MISYWNSYQMSVLRRILRMRAYRKRRELMLVADKTHKIKAQDILVFCTMHNENIRLPYFLDHYRQMGVAHFLVVDNDSDDGGREYLLEQPDVSLWHTSASYKDSRFGVDWLNYLQSRYGHGHWTLVVDPDELLVYPFCDTRPLNALTDWLDGIEQRSFSAMLLDMYPKTTVDSVGYVRGDNPIEVAPWFDAGNLTISVNKRVGNLWIQGGPRARIFFADTPRRSPALNKIPLVRWDKKYAYLSSTHMILPRGLNQTYDPAGGEFPSGILLHTKFLDDFQLRAESELLRHQHYANSAEYKAYADMISENNQMWCRWSERYINWRQLELLGLMSKGSWA